MVQPYRPHLNKNRHLHTHTHANEVLEGAAMKNQSITMIPPCLLQENGCAKRDVGENEWLYKLSTPTASPTPITAWLANFKQSPVGDGMRSHCRQCQIVRDLAGWTPSVLAVLACKRRPCCRNLLLQGCRCAGRPRTATAWWPCHPS